MRLFIFIAGVLVFFSAIKAEAFNPEPVACYPFSGNADDRSGHHHHGNVFGATLTSDRFNAPASAYEFNGADDFIQIGKMSDVTASNEFSVSVWIRPDQVKLQTILFLMPDQMNDRLNAMAYYNHNGAATTIWDFGDCYSGGRLMQPGITFSSSWQHWVYTVHPANGMKVYVNGILMYSQSASSALINRNRKLWIGGGEDASGAQFYFDGALDDLSLYETALTGQEVYQLFQMESVCSVLTQLSEQQPFQIYYNPQHHSISFPEHTIETNTNLVLLNVMGQQVHQQVLHKGTREARLPDAYFFRGMMILMLELGGGIRYVTQMPFVPTNH